MIKVVQIVGKNRVIVFWPKKKAPDIAEVAFSYKFCRKISYEQCMEAAQGCLWIDYESETDLDDLASSVDGDVFLVIRNPEILLSGSAVRCLIKEIEKGKGICGPVFNATDFVNQLASLTWPYVDVPTFLEVAELLAKAGGNDCFRVDAIDDSCFACAGEHIRKAIEIARGTETLSSSFPGQDLFIHRGALVHCFSDYYASDREDLVRLIPEAVRSILDVGCAKGGYGRSVRSALDKIYLEGVERNPLMAEQAKKFYDKVHISPIEKVKFKKKFDLINCGDILEHLVEPWNMLRLFYSLLNDRGYLVLSVPNVGHWSVLRQLLAGKFQYVPVGLLCVTHIRWFTPESIEELLHEAGFSIEVMEKLKLQPTPEGEQFINQMVRCGYGSEDLLRCNEIIIRAIKKG